MKHVRMILAFFSAAAILSTSAATSQDDSPPRLLDTTGSIGTVVDPTNDNESDPLLSGVSRTEVQSDVSDPSFERYVKPGLIGQACSSGDASLLGDIALQWNEAEQALRRPHRSGVTASFLMEKAAQLAADTGDKATLARLTRAAKIMKNVALVLQIETMEKLAGDSRVTVPEWKIDVNQVDTETFGRIRHLHDAVQSAALSSDMARLQNIAVEISATSLPEAEAKHLTTLVGQAIESVETDPAPADEALGKLIAESRSICRKCAGVGHYVRGFGVVNCDRCGGKGTVYDDDGGYVSGWDTETSGGSSEGNIQTDSQVKRRFQFTLWNGCDTAVVHFKLGSKRTEQLAPGARKSYSFVGNASDATLYIFNNKQKYSLKSGNHKFWWMSSGQVGFDMNNF